MWHEAERGTYSNKQRDKLLAIIRRAGFINPIRRGERQCYCGSLDFERLRNQRSEEKRHGQKTKNAEAHRAKGR
jgi:hypothetical protein